MRASRQAFDVVDEAGQANFDRRSSDSDGANEDVHPVLLLGEDDAGFQTVWRKRG
jgi:hypothetical protein